MRDSTRWGRRGAAAARLLLPLLLLAGCSPLYVLRAGYEEAKILSRRKPIDRLVADSATPPAQRAKLALVVRARDFARDSLRLEVGKSYTTFSQLDSDTLALILSAARKDAFRAHTWWFPIVGSVPYKGFFSESKARAAARELEEEGYDTYIRPTSAFSTLGWFNDPVVSPLLRYDSVSLANTVIHELVHNTFYAAGEAMFNESFAQFVGSRGAIALFCGPALSDAALCARARDDWEDERLFGRFLTAVVAELEAVYDREDLPREEKLRLREEVFASARRRYAEEVHPRLRVNSYASFTRGQLNNATLIGRRLYYGRLDLFEQLFQQSGEDLSRTLQRVLEAARGADDPYAAVEALVARPTSAPAPAPGA